MTASPHLGGDVSVNRQLAEDWQGRAQLPLTADSAFNGYISANVLFALERLGVFRELSDKGHLDVGAFCAATGGNEPTLRSLLAAARAFGHLFIEGDVVTATPAGAECIRMMGFFVWGVGGYNEVFANAAPLALRQRRYGEAVRRDEAMVAVGSAQADAGLMSHLVDEVLTGLDFGVVADLGSGTSARLCRIVGGRQGTRGIGLDISSSATALAEKAIAAAELTGRVRAVKADVLDVCLHGGHRELLGDVDVVMSFFLLHDLLSDPTTRADVLPSLRGAFPRAHTFLIADTVVRPYGAFDTTLPVFSVGFELAHALMGVPLHTREEYEELFVAAGFQMNAIVPLGAPHSYLFVLGSDRID